MPSVSSDHPSPDTADDSTDVLDPDVDAVASSVSNDPATGPATRDHSVDHDDTGHSGRKIDDLLHIPLSSSSSPVTAKKLASSPGTHIPILPSELRKHHESMKLKTGDQKPTLQPFLPLDLSDGKNPVHLAGQATDYDPEIVELECAPTVAPDRRGFMATPSHLSSSPLIDSVDELGALPTESLISTDAWQYPGPMSSYHSSAGALIRAKSFSMFESSHSDRPYHHRCQQNEDFAYRRARPTGAMVRDPYRMYPINGGNRVSEIVMPTQDWLNMQHRINSLETEIMHVSRTNYLLNQELDKVQGHLQRLTSQEGEEGWQREYEFLVQQVELMHRQLQLAYSSQSTSQHRALIETGAGSDIQQEKMTLQLHSEVKELTTSLKKWQRAFQQAEENYRRKCVGERVLKQTLREREDQLSSLVEKLAGNEGEFRKSILNYEEFLRLSSEIEELESKEIRDSKPSAVPGNDSLHSQKSTTSVTATKGVGASESDSVVHSSVDEQMPGGFPERHGSKSPLLQNVDHLTVSILSWAALLATYMLS
ncbi:hypothetical protein BGW38_006550 [Lunasporangiospora selenospora]|uniref:Uncharacterized protein n=1 Tax=Lunasporangiospora selenospora TaxID=979761 RepID=A0A9P6G335_9FUNG|nr:hypothetical protein BGW38_006550 [Lunasporangiospora selenospora]